MSRSRFFPSNDVTYGEWAYLLGRYSDTEAQDRRERLGFTLQRLTRHGYSPRTLHTALLLGIKLWYEHGNQLMTRKAARRRNAALAKAQKDVDRALRSLRELLPPGAEDWPLDDNELFALREVLLRSVHVPPAKRPRGGRPSEWKDETDLALGHLGVPESDRRELLTALGFMRDE